MLRCHYGASTFAKNLRRPRFHTMNSDADFTISSSVTDSMSATRSMMRGARAVSNSSRPRLSPQSSKTWHPLNGIVFSPRAGRPRMSSATTVGVERDMALHSNAEDNYVLASTTLTTSSTFTTQTESTKSQEKPQSTTNPAAPAAAGKKPAAPKPTEEETEDPKYDTLPKCNREWRMTEELFRVARNAAKETPASYWSHALYRGPVNETDKEQKKVTVHYCRSKLTTERILEKYFMDQKVIGFDIEWMVNASKNAGPKNNVSLIQIANEERVALFHLALYVGNKKEDLVSPLLKKILEDPDVTKVGVSIKGDCTRLRNNLEIDPHGLFELSHLFKLVKFSETKEFKQINKKLISLATQVQEHFHLPMFKGGDVRSGAWNKALNLEQIRYAASDSYAGIQLFLDMEAKREELDPTPPRPFYAELNIPIRTAEGVEIPTDEPADLDENGEDIKPEEPETPAPTKRKYTRKTVPAPVGGLEGENINTEREPPAPKRKYNKKPIPYFAAEEPLDFEDRAIEGALMDINYESPATRTQTKTTRPKPAPKQKEEEESDEEFFECMRDPGNPTEGQPPSLEASSTKHVARDNDPQSPIETATSQALRHLNTLPAQSTSTTKQPTLPSLRTFFLWHQNPHLTLQDLASVLRSPPLSITTVAQHILEVASWGIKNLSTEHAEGQENEKRDENPIEGSRVREVFRLWDNVEIEGDRVKEVLGVWRGMGFSDVLWEGLEEGLNSTSAEKDK